MPKEEKINSGIRIKEIKEISFSNKIDSKIVNDFDEKNVEINLGFSVKGDSKKKTISLMVLIDYRFKSPTTSKKSKDFLKLETETTFETFNLTDKEVKYDDEKSRVFVNDELMVIFLNTAIGATRGMFAYKMASLPINLVVPLLDVKAILDNKNHETENRE